MAMAFAARPAWRGGAGRETLSLTRRMCSVTGGGWEEVEPA